MAKTESAEQRIIDYVSKKNRLKAHSAAGFLILSDEADNLGFSVQD